MNSLATHSCYVFSVLFSLLSIYASLSVARAPWLLLLSDLVPSVREALQSLTSTLNTPCDSVWALHLVTVAGVPSA